MDCLWERLLDRLWERLLDSLWERLWERLLDSLWDRLWERLWERREAGLCPVQTSYRLQTMRPFVFAASAPGREQTLS